jgi:hypothetical protein
MKKKKQFLLELMKDKEMLCMRMTVPDLDLVYVCVVEGRSGVEVL